MMEARGFKNEHLSNMTVNGFKRRFATANGVPSLERLNNDFVFECQGRRILFCFAVPTDKVGVKEIREFSGRLGQDERAFRGVLIVKNGISPFGLQLAKISRTDESKIPLEWFSYAELRYNLVEHEMVPRHEVLSYEQKMKLLERYKIELNQLPRLLTTDPIARYYGLVAEQVVRIIRKSPTAGSYVTYRVLFDEMK